MATKLPRTVNRKLAWMLVDENGKVIQRFRLKTTAIQSKYYYQQMYVRRLKVKPLKRDL